MYKNVVSGRKELWDEYCRLRKEIKEAVREGFGKVHCKCDFEVEWEEVVRM